VAFVTLHQLETVLDSVLDSNSSQAIGDLIARRVLYPVETRGPVMVPGAVTPGVCIRGPVFRVQSFC